jgi:hypothetical protein
MRRYPRKTKKRRPVKKVLSEKAKFLQQLSDLSSKDFRRKLKPVKPRKPAIDCFTNLQLVPKKTKCKPKLFLLRNQFIGLTHSNRKKKITFGHNLVQTIKSCALTYPAQSCNTTNEDREGAKTLDNPKEDIYFSIDNIEQTIEDDCGLSAISSKQISDPHIGFEKEMVRILKFLPYGEYRCIFKESNIWIVYLMNDIELTRITSEQSCLALKEHPTGDLQLFLL